MIFSCPETTYNRDHSYDIDIVQDDKLEQLVETEHRNDISHRSAKTESEVATSSSDGDAGNTTPPHAPPAKTTFLQSMAIFTGKYTNDNMCVDNGSICHVT
jgi:hypothetical protein